MKSRFSETEIEGIRQRLQEKRLELEQSELSRKNEAFDELSNEAVGEISKMRLHNADMGSKNAQQEIDIQIMEHDQDEIEQIDRALSRLDKNKYGTCEKCGCAISMKRLLAFPEAEFCITCKKELEAKVSLTKRPNYDSGETSFTPLIDQVQKNEFK